MRRLKLKLAFWLIGRADELLPISRTAPRMEAASGHLRRAEVLVAEHLDGYPETQQKRGEQ